MTSTETVLRTSNLTKIYSGKPAVDAVSFSIKKGEIFGLIGKNGAGKTTLIRLITALAHPDEGEIELFGEKEPIRLHRERSRLGCIVGTPAFYPGLTVGQNLEYSRLQLGIPDHQCISSALEQAGLSGSEKMRCSRLPPGIKQRLGLALAILNNPDFILLDEPTSGLDPLGVAEMRETLQHLHEEMGITMLISSPILSELHHLATVYGIIHQGKLVKEISGDQLDEECRSCLCVKVDNIQVAATVLETVLGTTHYQIIDRNEIRVYDHLEDPAEVTYQLSLANVRISQIYEMGMKVDDYFRSVIQAGE